MSLPTKTESFKKNTERGYNIEYKDYRSSLFSQNIIQEIWHT